MSEQLLLDTGPLVALLHSGDSNHRRCLEFANSTTASLVTCWPVLTEAAWLLRSDSRDVLEMLRYVAEDELAVYDLPSKAAGWIAEFMRRFADQNPQLADAALMYVAEHEKIETVFTLDLRDFSVFRTTDNRPLGIVPG